MKPLRRFFKRLSSGATRQRDEARLQAEIEDHLALQTAENIRAGLPPTEARRQAALKFGPVESTKESYRDGRGLPFVETLLQDTRYPFRSLRKAPAFTLTTVLILALGIGATTSIFTLVYAVLLKSLAVANPAELYRLGKEARCCYWGGYSQDREFSLVSYDLYKYFRDHTEGFAELAAFSASEQLYGVRRQGISTPAQSLPGESVSGNYFRMFGLHAYAGRLLTPRDDQPGSPPVAVMSYALWHRNYSADSFVVGSVFNLSDRPFTIVGIAPPSFFGDTLRNPPPDFVLPLTSDFNDPNSDIKKPATHWLDLIGRVRPGFTRASVEAQMRVELKQWLRSHWGQMSANERLEFPQQTLYLRPGGAGITSMRGQYEHWLQTLMLVSAFVLLIVCANVANLMLVRGLERRRQTSLSMALGAQARRLVRQALTESLLLSLAGGAAGLTVAFAGTRLILHYAFPPFAGSGAVPIDPSPSSPVLLFSLAVSLLTGIIFGIAPAWVATRVDPIEALRGANRSTSRTGGLPRKSLVVFQAMLSLVLLSASGLLTAALHKLETQDFGFDVNHRTIVNFDARLAGYPNAQLTPLFRRIHGALAGIPGVSAVALCTYSPLSGNNWGYDVWVDGHPAPGPNDDVAASYDRVTAGYLAAIGNPIFQGRGITAQDTADSQHVAVINEAFARKFFKNEDPIGKHFGRSLPGASRLYEIVGIAKDARYLTYDLDKPIAPFFFLPETQSEILPGATTEDDPGSHYMRDIVVVAKPGNHVSSAKLRQAIASVDPNLPLISIQSLRGQVAIQFSQQRLLARLTSFFGLLSLVLASIGLYGVTAYNAGRRANEIGIRMALGANRGNVIALILKGAFTLIFLGLAIGFPITFAAGKFLGAQLYGINPYNATVTLIAVAALGLSAFIAALLPALRASHISPLDALRSE